MRYTVRPSDTWVSVASALTLSADYASAIAEYNGVQDVEFASDGSDRLVPVNIGMPIGRYGLTWIDIPDNWLKPGAASTTGSASGIMGALTANPALFLGLGALALLAFLPRKR